MSITSIVEYCITFEPLFCKQRLIKQEIKLTGFCILVMILRALCVDADLDLEDGQTFQTLHVKVSLQFL